MDPPAAQPCCRPQSTFSVQRDGGGGGVPLSLPSCMPHQISGKGRCYMQNPSISETACRHSR
eukprot:3810450-Rhodomonas_salina.5